MSDWKGGVNDEGESPLHLGWGIGDKVEADCCRRLGILAGMGMGMGMGISEATCHRHRNNGQSWKVLGMQSQGLVGLVCLEKTWQSAQNPRDGKDERR